MFSISQKKIQIFRCIFHRVGMIFFLCVTEFAWSESCPDQAVGVHETRTANGVIYVSLAKAIALSELDGSIELASAEARILAKRQLIARINSSLGYIKNINGAMDISTCVIGQTVFSKIVVTENSMRQANKLYDAINNSLVITPTPRP
jgi:hypothetical protein